MSGHRTTLTHRWEASHRLPQLDGKCRSLHGHSWRTKVTLGFPELDENGIGVEFSAYKRELRDWIDTHLDHGSMLSGIDPLVPLLNDAFGYEMKIFRFGIDDPADEEAWAKDLTWPTVESVAVLLYRVAEASLISIPHVDGLRVVKVKVQETATNSHTYAGPA
jgi:6-pyruvoyltetrahydropterin/6-carboxytetrahydropterin synthase